MGSVEPSDHIATDPSDNSHTYPSDHIHTYPSDCRGTHASNAYVTPPQQASGAKGVDVKGVDACAPTPRYNASVLLDMAAGVHHAFLTKVSVGNCCLLANMGEHYEFLTKVGVCKNAACCWVWDAGRCGDTCW